MSDCSMLEKCTFFNDKMAVLPVSADMIKKRFCLKDNSYCARYRVLTTLGKEKLPADLFPTAEEEARQILAGKGLIFISHDLVVDRETFINNP